MNGRTPAPIRLAFAVYVLAGGGLLALIGYELLRHVVASMP